MAKKKPPPIEVPSPEKYPEIDPEYIPEDLPLPDKDEDFDIIPEEDPFTTPPYEVPPPGESP